MIYRVKLDGNDILDYQDKRYVLLNPSLNLVLGGAGSFEFTVPPSHELYDDIHLLTSDVEVYEGEELIWFGRPIEIETDFYKQKRVYCEGALSFFNDSVQLLHEYDSVSLHSFFFQVVAAHNSQVPESRQFTIGTVSVPDRTVYRKLSYDATFDVLRKQCIGSDGGYLLPRRVNGVNYIDWSAEMPYHGNQPAELGLNLLDLIGATNGSKIVTCVVPLGDNVQTEDGVSGGPLTVASVNNGSVFVESAAAATFGRITKAVSFSGVTDPGTLYEDGVEYLAQYQFADLTITCKASDIHLQNANYDSFRLGQMVRCHSTPHLLDRELGIVEMTLRLDTEKKELTLGNLKTEKLTDILKDSSAAIQTEQAGLQELQDYLADELSDLNEHVDYELQDMQTQIDEVPKYPDIPTIQEFNTRVDAMETTVTGMDDTVTDLSDAIADLNERLTSVIGDSGGSSGGGTDPSGGGSDVDPSGGGDIDPSGGGSDIDPSGGGDVDPSGGGTDYTGVTINDLDQRLSDLENVVHGWTHQINGVTSETGVVNFVTTSS